MNATYRVCDVGCAEGEGHSERGGQGTALRPQHGGHHIEGQLVARGQRDRHKELAGQGKDDQGQGGLRS